MTTNSMRMRAHAATIDIIDSRTPPAERREGGQTVVIPNEIYVDGVPLYVPRDSKISMDIDGHGNSPVEVTMTFFARRVRVGFADELDGPAAALPSPVIVPVTIPVDGVEAAAAHPEPEQGTPLNELGLPTERASWKVTEGDWVRLGVDIAGDELIVARAVGDLLTIETATTVLDGSNPVFLGERVLGEIRRAEALRARLRQITPVRVKISPHGMGWAVIAFLNRSRADGEHSAEIVPVSGNRPAADAPEGASLRPARQRDEMWLTGRALLAPDGGESLVRLRVDNVTKAQLSAPRITTRADGLTHVETATELRARSAGWIAKAEALLRAVYEPPVAAEPATPRPDTAEAAPATSS
ncbi:hypothetical protein [Nonomuraea sp. NPDC003214]